MLGLHIVTNIKRASLIVLVGQDVDFVVTLVPESNL